MDEEGASHLMGHHLVFCAQNTSYVQEKILDAWRPSYMAPKPWFIKPWVDPTQI